MSSRLLLGTIYGIYYEHLQSKWKDGLAYAWRCTGSSPVVFTKQINLLGLCEAKSYMALVNLFNKGVSIIYRLAKINIEIFKQGGYNAKG